MEQYAIKGGIPLVGEVEIGGANNAALTILAAAIMTDETVLIDNVPDVSDINILLQAMENVGAIITRVDRHTVKINGSQISGLVIEDEFIKKLERPIIYWELYLVNIKRLKLLFQEAVILEVVQLINTLKVLKP